MWYYAGENGAVGPIPEAEAAERVRSGVIGRRTLVWTEGMDAWQEAGATPLFTGVPGAPPLPPPAAAARPDVTLCVLAHVLGLLTGFIGPLVILLASPEPRVKQHARAALNWQLSLILYSIISIILVFVFVGVLLLLAIYVMDLIFCIVAAVKAGQGTAWKYPMTIPFVRG